MELLKETIALGIVLKENGKIVLQRERFYYTGIVVLNLRKDDL